jgi:hypothetical protein
MNIIEAIKSGKRFRRPAWKEWSTDTQCNAGYVWSSGNQGGSTTVSGMFLQSADITADDWEIEEKKVEITRSQFFSAVDKVLAKAFDGTPRSHEIAKELGLE